jgi:hypothetical protein
VATKTEGAVHQNSAIFFKGWAKNIEGALKQDWLVECRDVFDHL